MKVGIYSVYDKKAHLYSNPFVSQNNDTAKRYFEYVVGNSDMVKTDLELYQLAYFDTETGAVISIYDDNLAYKPLFVSDYQLLKVEVEANETKENS